MILSFNDVELDRSTCRVRVGGADVHVEPQVYDVLALLIEHRDRVVSKEELLDRVWGSRFVSESALTSRIKSARLAVGDSGREQHTIRTVHGKGYQFVAPVEEVEPGRRSGGHPPGADRPDRPDRPGAVTTFPPLRRPDNGFHGREDELADVSARLDDHRLVTIVGHGGTGKTRLGIEVVHRRGDAAVFLDLAEVRDGDAVAQALVAALGIDVGSGEDEITAATTFLRGTTSVLIVDNCEHVLDPAAAMVRRILAETPSVVVLATTRRPLGLRDEHLVRLDPLPLVDDTAVPDDALANPAVTLFLDRAQQASRGLVLDRETTPQVVSLCRALDGLPLALELAAGRASTFALGDLLRRLDRRLDLLGDERADTHERHRSLRAALDWSFDQLDPASQELFLHLAVFPGGVTLEGAEWLVERLDLDADAWRVIDRLVTASLVDRVDHPSGGRYVQLETMRSFGADHLADRGRLRSARDLQAASVLELLEELRRTLQTERELEWDDRIRRELPNIRYARQHLHDEDRHRDLLRVSTALDMWAMFRDVSEIWVWADELRDIDGWTPREQSRVRALCSLAAWRRGRVRDAARLGREAGAADDDRWARQRGLNAYAAATLFQGDYEAAAAAWLEGYELSGNMVDLATAALPLAYDGQLERARRVATDAHQGVAEEGWPTGIAWTSYVAAEVEARAGHPSAQARMEEAVARAREVGSSFTYGVASVTLCSLLNRSGDLAAAAAGYRDLITHWLRSGSWTQLWTTVRNAVELVCNVEPGLCLLTLDFADQDALASELDDEARHAQDALRERLVATLGPEHLEELEAERATLDRVDLATRVRAALDDRHRQLTTAASP